MACGRGIAAAVIGSLVLAAPAHAESGLVDLGVEHLSAGPVLAGDRVAWATFAAPGEVDLHLSRFDGSDRRTVRVAVRGTAAAPAGGSVSSDLVLAASERRWALRVVRTHCADESACKYQQNRTIHSAVLSGSLGERPERVTGCDGVEECRPCDTDRGSLDVSADAIAYDEPCRRGVATVRDFAPGAVTPERSFSGAGAIRIAGRFAAIERSNLEVHDWTSGELRFALDERRYNDHFDVQEDGTLAYTQLVGEFDGELAWASPEEPYAHRVGVRGGDPFMYGIAKGRIAFSRQHERDVSSHLGVVGLGGDRRALVRPSAEFIPATFDGERVAYAQRPCAVTGLVVWDLTGQPPALPRDGCPPMRLASSRARLDLANGRLSVRLRCPAQPRLGCYGHVSVSALHRRVGREKRFAYNDGRIALAPGADEVVELKVARRTACNLTRAGDTVRARIELDSWDRDESGRTKVRRSLRVRGLAACDR